MKREREIKRKRKKELVKREKEMKREREIQRKRKKELVQRGRRQKGGGKRRKQEGKEEKMYLYCLYGVCVMCVCVLYLCSDWSKFEMLAFDNEINYRVQRYSFIFK